MFIVSAQEADGSTIDVFQAPTRAAADAYVENEDSYGDAREYVISKMRAKREEGISLLVEESLILGASYERAAAYASQAVLDLHNTAYAEGWEQVAGKPPERLLRHERPKLTLIQGGKQK